jgi:hypothetical protein
VLEKVGTLCLAHEQDGCKMTHSGWPADDLRQIVRALMKGADEAQATRSAKIEECEVAVTPEEMHKLAGLHCEALTDSLFHRERAAGTPA